MRLFGRRTPVSASLMGKIIQVGGYELKVEAHLGEGGFASIYRVRDASTSEVFALKHIRLADGSGARGQTRREVCHEAKNMKRVRGHPNVLALVAVAFSGGPREEETDAYVLMDLCTDTLYEYLQSKEFKLEDTEVLEIFESTCRAVEHMHSQSPPIAHRDIKVENVLRRSTEEWVLCDFGSASSSVRRFHNAVDSQEEEEYLSKKTTPAYRAPEMWDLMMGHVINTKVDIWALGCMLYLLCFGKLPFTGDSKLQVLSGKFVMPATRPSPLRSLISSILIADPSERPDIVQVLQSVQQTHDAIVSGDYSVTNSSKSIGRPSSAAQSRSSPFSQANIDTTKTTPGSGAALDMAPAASLPNPEELNNVLAALPEATAVHTHMENSRLRASGELHRSMSMGQPQDWTASFGESQWPVSTAPQRDSESAAGTNRGTGDLVMGVPCPPERQNGNPVSPPTDHREKVSAENGIEFQEGLQLMRKSMQSLTKDNMSLELRVKALEDVVSSQQRMIQGLLGVATKPSQSIQEPLASTPHPQSARETPSGGLSASNASPRPSSSNHVSGQPSIKPSKRAHVLKKHKDLSESQKSSGTFWDRYEDEDHEENLEIIAQHSELENKTGNQSVLQIAEASSNAPSHRRIVSDPPPLESWHLGDIE